MIRIIKIFFFWLSCMIHGHEPWDFDPTWPILSFTDYKSNATYDFHICIHCEKVYLTKTKDAPARRYTPIGTQVR